jgi:ribose transport system permease protein
LSIVKKDINYIEYFYKYGLYIVFVLLVMVFSILTPNFLKIDNILNIILQSSSLGIAVVGISFVILTAGIDISLGSTMFFSAVTTAFFATRNLNIFILLALSLICGAVIGAINGLVISRWRVVPFIATLATMSVWRGIAVALSGNKIAFFTGESAKFLTKTRIVGVPIIVIVFIIIAIAGQYVLKFTEFGRQIYAIGNNKAIAEMIGINVRSKVFIVYLIAGVLAGLSGLIASVQVGAVIPTFGKNQEFIIISSAVLGGVSLFGGKGSIIPGAFIGVLIITCIENGLVLINADPYFYQITRGLVIFIAVMVDCIRNKGELR